MMKITNKFNLPEVIVRAVSNDPYDAGESDISVTRLISPVKQVHLQRLHGGELTEDASDRIWALLGSSVHAMLERAAGEDDIVEERYFKEVQGWNVSGQIDLISQGTLYDFKVSSAWSALGDPKPEWVQQLNLLNYLSGGDIDKLAIILICRDWSKFRAMKGGDYPSSQVIEIPIEKWSREKTEKYLLERLTAHQRAFNGDSLPLCSKQERWAKDDVWAIMKKGRKSAVKLHSNEEDAEKHLESLDKNHSIELRVGEDVRCGNYCSVNQHCEQFLTKTEK